MKKYLFGSIAIVVAVTLVAFTSPKEKETSKKPFATYTFRYKLTSDFSQASVQNNNNWEAGTASCGGSLDACTIEVTDTYTHTDAMNKRVLNTSGSVINIVATGSGSDYKPNPTASTGVPSATNQN